MVKNLANVVNPEPQPLEVVNRIINACADAKGKDIRVLDVSTVFGLADYFVIVSGRSDRQVQGITNKVLDTLLESNLKPINVEGIDEGHWVLADFGDVILHVFYEPVRAHYDIESLWFRARKLEIKNDKNQNGIVLRAA
ncbi:MAG: ribosome silencing factor [Bdellovibrionales bacterium]|nr:ribosome silencing factor [Bdellovibrionales bacterium]